jgi:hypothetical protein
LGADDFGEEGIEHLQRGPSGSGYPTIVACVTGVGDVRPAPG